MRWEGKRILTLVECQNSVCRKFIFKSEQNYTYIYMYNIYNIYICCKIAKIQDAVKEHTFIL